MMRRAFPAVLCLAVLGGCGDPPPAPAAVESFTVTPDSVRLYYRTIGSGPRTVIAPNALFIGGSLDALAAGGFRIVTYDPRGRGRSDAVRGAKNSLERNIADVEAIRLAVRADSFALIGWSGMGMELFVYALREPGRVTRLVQLAPVAPRFVPWGDSMQASRAARTDAGERALHRERLARGVFKSRDADRCSEEARITTPATFGDTSLVRLAPDVCLWPNEWPDSIARHFGEFFPTLGAWNWVEQLTRVTIPRLVIHGALDNTPLAGNCEWMTGQPAASRIVVIDGAGHWPHYERPGETLAAMREFLRGGWPLAARVRC